MLCIGCLKYCVRFRLEPPLQITENLCKLLFKLRYQNHTNFGYNPTDAFSLILNVELHIAYLLNLKL